MIIIATTLAISGIVLMLTPGKTGALAFSCILFGMAFLAVWVYRSRLNDPADTRRKVALSAILLFFLGGVVLVDDVKERLGTGTSVTAQPPASTSPNSWGLEAARKKAADALVSQDHQCPRLYGSLSDAFSSGLSVERYGSWYLRVRCTDEAYLVIVSETSGKWSTCKEAVRMGLDCYDDAWIEKLNQTPTPVRINPTLIQNANTPTPNTYKQTEPTSSTKTSERGLSLDEGTYSEKVVENAGYITNALRRMSELILNPQIGNNRWALDLAAQSAAVKLAYQEALEMVPPTKFKKVHTQYLSALALYDEAVDDLNYGIDNLDKSRLDRAAKRIVEGNESMDKATAMLIPNTYEQPEPTSLTKTSEQGLSLDEGAYAEKVVENNEYLINAINEIRELNSNPQMGNYSWSFDMAAEIVIVKSVYKEALKMVPPTRLKKVHAQYLSALALYDEAMDDFIYWLDNLDVQRLDSAGEKMLRGNESLDRATALLREFR